MKDRSASGRTARNHLSCWRLTRSARRQRSVTHATAAAAAATPHTTARTCIALNSPSSLGTVYGFGSLWKRLPMLCGMRA
jgi:hypothetical protein